VLVATKFLTAKLYSRYVKVVGYFEKVAVGFGHFPPTLLSALCIQTRLKGRISTNEEERAKSTP